MIAFDQKRLERNNRREFNRLATWLSQGPKVVIQAMAVEALASVMRSYSSGGKLVHDTSNAAFNWQVTLGGSVSYKEFRGESPVAAFDDYRGRFRSSMKKEALINSVISTRLESSVSIIDKGVWAFKSNRPVSIHIVNPIYGTYAKNARLQEASEAWKDTALLAGQRAFAMWLKGGPDIDWSKASVAVFGGI